jgi:predicted metal-dependent phosphoesterase TrpH
MPARQPYTTLCKAASRVHSLTRVDLHVHSTHSDGLYTPAEIVDLARRSGLAALAITDHDTLEAITPAQAAAAGSALEIVPAVEISARHRDRDLHLLAYFVSPEDTTLRHALAQLQQRRTDRFWEMIERLRAMGVSLNRKEAERYVGPGVLGRRHVAALLVQTGRAATIRQAFARYLRDGGRVALPNCCLAVEEAISLIRGAGGVAAWAHPSYDCSEKLLTELSWLGLGALEVEYPGYRGTQKRLLRNLAERFGLAVTGGSDCHGPDQSSRAVGACGITVAELDRLRQMAWR